MADENKSFEEWKAKWNAGIESKQNQTLSDDADGLESAGKKGKKIAKKIKEKFVEKKD